MRDAQGAIFAASTFSLSLMLPTVHDVVVAWLAEVVTTLGAQEESNRATVHAFEVDKLVTVLFAYVIAEAELFPGTRPTQKVFFSCIVLR